MTATDTPTTIESMSEILHAWALAPAAAGACCLAADRRVRAPELAASLLMLGAMLDGAVAGLIPPVYWAGMLLLAAMALAALRRYRRSATRHDGEDEMALHTAAGLVTMAAVTLVAGHGAASAAAHVHGPTGAGLLAAVLAACAGFAAWSAVSTVRAPAPLDRAQYAAMGASVLLMAAAAV